MYLERTPGSNTGILTWKIDFTPCGLVVDQILIKVESHNLNGGEVLVMLASGNTKKTISHMEGKQHILYQGRRNEIIRRGWVSRSCFFKYPVFFSYFWYIPVMMKSMKSS